MSDEQEYLDQIEQHELVKNEGVSAWVDAIAEMLPNTNEDKRILIKQGLQALLNGPPHLPLLRVTAPAHIDAEFIDVVFEERDEENGITRLWDWQSIAAGITHLERGTNTLRAFRYDELIITLTGEAAESFWKFINAVRQRRA